ncbi:MAG TPA: DUF697 domain-containing protein [Acholeplasma sp.]|jgi:uncharacterized membrane protein YcjF (UPF0283 family)
MKKSSTRMWYVIGVGVVILILMMLVASVIQIGEQLKNIHEYVAYGFYGLAALLLYLLIIRPVAIILYSPSFSVETTLDKNPKRAYKVFKQVARRLLEQEELSDAIKENIKQSMKDPHKLRDAMNNAYNHDIKKRMNKSIQNHARTVLISTAISQNGRLDFITVIVVNIQMIKDLVVMCGFRPSYKNLAKLVVNVFTTALIAEGLENINLSDILPQSTMQMLGEIPLVRPMISSVLDGISNALLTLRIGIVARKYLFDDAEDLTKEKIRFGALIEATKHLPIVIADALFIFPKSIFNIFKPKAKKNEEIDL